MRLKSKFGAIRGVVRSVVILEWVWAIKNMFFEILTRKVVIVKNVDFACV